ncbi:MAG: OmpA family protein [Bacteroidota bacterium]|nr:OmpA family protein [Bacteroidota bacterium]
MNFSYQFGLILYLLIPINQLLSQKNPNAILLANEHYTNGNYRLASQWYLQDWDHVKQDKNNLKKAAISFYNSNRLVEAANAFQYLAQQDDDMEVLKYLSSCLQAQYKFREALVSYKNWYRKLKKNDADRDAIKNEMHRCLNGIQLKRNEPRSLVEPMGGDVNTSRDEYAAYPSKSQTGKYFFSAVREKNEGGKRNSSGWIDEKNGIYRSDIFVIEDQNGKWMEMKKWNPLLNTSRHDEILEIYTKEKLYILFQSWEELSGEMVILDHQLIPATSYTFESDVYPEIGDQSLSIFEDTIMIFSSNRAGGYGGYDLYLSQYLNNRWTSPVNLGNEINTPFNECFPFIAKDGRTLYFSSNNLASIGGYDIFKTSYLPESKTWILPENIGMPINSSGNETHFRLRGDGVAGVFSSDRKDKSMGARDIFLAYFNYELEEQKYASKGSVLSEILIDREKQNYVESIGSTDYSIKQKNEASFHANYDIDAIYYKGEDFIIEAKNKKILENIIHIMKVNPELALQVTTHSSEELSDGVNLYFSIKKSEKVSEYLELNGISSKRITCMGAGHSFPFVKTDLNQYNFNQIQRWNNRIEFYFIPSVDSLTITFNYLTTNVPKSIQVNEVAQFRNLRRGLTYSIHLGASEGMFNLTGWNQKEWPLFVKYDQTDEKYHYYCGILKTFDEAEQLAKQIEVKQNRICTLEGFMDGRKLGRREIIDYIVPFPDLILYIHYVNQQEDKR